MDTTWFKARLQEARISQRGLAKLIGVDPAAVSLTFNGRRKLQLKEAGAIAAILHRPVTEILLHAGIPIGEETPTVPLVGYIDGAGEAHIDWRAEPIDRAIVPPDIPANAVAVQYRTAGSSQEALDGWTVYILPPDAAREAPVNRMALVALRSGISLVGFLRRGYRLGTYNIQGFGTMLESVEVAWASPVLLIRP